MRMRMVSGESDIVVVVFRGVILLLYGDNSSNGQTSGVYVM